MSSLQLINGIPNISLYFGPF